MVLRKIDLMHKLFGELPDRKCKDCQHLESYTASRKWYKCGIYGNTSSEASDWRLKWTACGLFNKEYNGNPIVKMATREKESEEQIEGQVSIFNCVEVEKSI